MEEQLINYDTAVLAKEKGFDEPVRDCYVQYVEGKISINTTSSLYKQNIDHNVKQHSAPTQSLLQKWLRDEYNIDIIIIQIELNEYRSCSLTHSDITSIIDGDYTIYDFIDMSYSGSGVFEDALENGLQEALKLIEV